MKFKKLNQPSASWTIDPSYIEDDVINKLRKPINAKIEQGLSLSWETPNKEVCIRWVARFLIPSNEKDKYAGRFDMTSEMFYEVINEEPSDDIEELIQSSHNRFIDEFRRQKESEYFDEPPQVSQDTIDDYVESFHTLLEEK